ncbi:MAG: hypothetical protein Kow0029_29360 [Candidatus Rifleibacteriota bacterium]
MSTGNSSFKKNEERAEMMLLKRTMKNKVKRSISSSFDTSRPPIMGPNVSPSIGARPTYSRNL